MTSTDAGIREWRWLQALAAMTLLLVILPFGGLLFGSVTHRIPEAPFQSPLQIFLFLCFIAGLLLWVRMLIAFFQDRPRRRPVLWGLFLLCGSFIGALTYFWVVWRPRNSPGDNQ